MKNLPLGSHIDIECPKQESIHVSKLLDQHCRWFSKSMTGFRLNANQDGCIPCLGRLEGGGKLERVPRDNPIVMIGGDHQGRGVFRPGLEVVKGRISEESLELFRIV